MRILHTSDWHLGKSLEHISRIEEQRAFIDCLCKMVEAQDIDLVVVAGDVFDTYNPSAAAEELFYEAVDRLNARGTRSVVVIAGNHDNPERLCAASPLAYKNGIILLGYPSSNAAEYSVQHSQIRIADAGPGWFELSTDRCKESVVIISMPYPSEARLEEVLTKQADEGMLQRAYSEKIGSILANLSEKFREDTVNIVLGHLFLMGGRQSDSERTLQVGGAMTVDPRVLPGNAHAVLLGHLHRPQEIRSAPCPAYYSGSPLAYSFSEAEHSKAVYILDVVPGEKADIQPMYLDCGKPLRRWTAEGIGQALEWCEAGRDSNAWVDLEILTDRVFTPEEQKRLRALHPGIVNIRPRLRTEETEALSPQSREGRKIEDLFQDYYQYRMQREIPEDLLAVFIEVFHEEAEMQGEEMGI